MDIELIGPGRAGGALAIAAHRAGHRIVGIVGRTPRSERDLAGAVRVHEGTADLRIIAVRDADIAAVAQALASESPTPTVHVSGSTSISVLDPIARSGAPIGSFHPLQTLPNPVTGADRLPGAWIAITAEPSFASELEVLAESLGCIPFALDDDRKPAYHAAAAAAANFPLASLAVAERLTADAGVPFDALRPLVDAIVANAFDLGPTAALTGPIARGDVETVQRQLAAVDRLDPSTSEAFRHLARATVEIAGASDAMREVIE